MIPFHVKFTGIALVILFFITGCSKAATAVQFEKQAELKKIEKQSVSHEDKLYTACNTAGIQLLQKISAANEGKNTIFSPVSFAAVLAVLNNGAAGKTRYEINALINPEQLSPAELNEKYCHTINHLINTGYRENGNQTTVVELANSLWIQKNLRVKDDFLNTSNTYYGTEAYNVNFKDNSTINAMNRWIEDKTYGRIQNHIIEFNPPPVMVVFNSLYFNGKWQNPFDQSKTQKEDFHLNNGDIAKVEMMNAEKRMQYYEDDQIQAGKFDYYGCSMLVILPKGDSGNYFSNLNYAEIRKADNNLENMKVKIKFPKFNFKQKNKLADYLKTMGLESAFDYKNADFTAIADRSDRFNLYISDISQECFINVDEEGTEAAVLTSVLLAGSGMPRDNVPPEFYLNKPFIFVISDDRTGLILFAGKVENPLEEMGNT